MFHFSPSERSHASGDLFLTNMPMHVPPLTLSFLRDFAVALIKKAEVRVSEVANKNIQWTLKEHQEGHRRDELIRRKCEHSYNRTLRTKII